MRHALARRITWIGIIIFCALSHAPSVWGFAEEPLYFKDFMTGLGAAQKVSSVHTELHRAFAFAAGFTDVDAAKMAIYNQLTDSAQFSSAETNGWGTGKVYYTNCDGAFPGIPNPDNPAVCPNGKGDGALIFPLYTNQNVNGRPCATVRPGYFGPSIHFPRADRGELENIRKWAYGESKVLKGYASFAWGRAGVEYINADCHYQVPMNIETGIQPGSIQAFGLYMHSLADSIHHSRCIAAIVELETTRPGIFSFPIRDPLQEPTVCHYDWTKPDNYDENGVEFGSGNGTYRSDLANKTIFDAMVTRAVAKEGKYCPLEWDTILTAMEGSPTIEQAAYNFIHNWAYEKETGNKGEYAALRRAYAAQMIKAIKAQRTLSTRATMAGLSPARSQTAGLGSDLALTITGKNIAADAVVRWNGEALSASYVNPWKMTAIVPASRIATEGIARVTVYNPRGCGESEGKTFAFSYPSPALSRLNPAGSAQDVPAFTLTLTGRNFIPASRVWWTMGSTVTELPVTYVSSTRLQVQVTETMVANPGLARVQVETPGAKSLKSGRLSFRIK